MNLRIILSFGILILATACSKKIANSNIVARIDGESYNLQKSEEVSKRWNNLLVEKKIQGRVSALSVLKGRDSINRKNYYYLLGKSKNDSIKVAHLLVKRGENLFFDEKKYPLTVVCYGCSDSYPKMSFDKWGWSCETQNLTDCKKMVVVHTN